MQETPRTNRTDALGLAGLHALVALYLWMGRGVTIVHDYGPDPWSWFWQNIPADLLRDRAVESLWWLHAQPPLWNALGALLIKVFGEHHLPALQVLNILLGSGIVALVVTLVARHTASRRWSLGMGVVMALHPALFLYEAYALYTVVVAFLVLLGAFLLDLRRGAEAWWPLLGFIAVLSALILTRSLFHLILLAGAIPLVLVLKGRPPQKVMVALLVLALVPAGWYGKNLAQHGFFGASSWYGIGLWRSVLFQQDQALLARSLDDGALDPIVQIAPFSPPSAYVPMGYAAPTPFRVVAGVEFLFVFVPAISRAYDSSAKALILRAPGRYAANVLRGYGNFSAPSSGFRHLDPNRERMGLLGRLDQWLFLRPAVAAVERGVGVYLGSLYFILIPGVLAAWAFTMARAPAPGGWRQRVRRDGTLFAVAGLVLYTTVVGCSMELGENVRFKFLVEPAFLVLMAVTLHRLLGGRPQEDRQDAPGA